MDSSRVALLPLLKEGWFPLGQLGTFGSCRTYPELLAALGKGSAGWGAAQLERLCTFCLGAVWVSVISRGLRTGYPAEIVLEGLAVWSCRGNKGCEVFLSRRQAANWCVHAWPSKSLSFKGWLWLVLHLMAVGRITSYWNTAPQDWHVEWEFAPFCFFFVMHFTMLLKNELQVISILYFKDI